MPEFDPALFLLRLRQRGCRLGEPLEYSPQSISTNDEAKRALREGARSGATFVADTQTAGRGRRGREWFSAAGESLLFSVVVQPRLSPEQMSTLTLAAGLGVRESLARTVDVPLCIKWPNDVLANGRKLAGILVEGETVNDEFSVVIGVGINVATLSFPAPLDGIATSLALLGASPQRETLLVDVLRAMESWITRLEAGQLGLLATELRAHDALLGRRLSVDGVSGVGAGIDPSGHLLLRTPDELLAIHSGTVEIQ